MSFLVTPKNPKIPHLAKNVLQWQCTFQILKWKFVSSKLRLKGPNKILLTNARMRYSVPDCLNKYPQESKIILLINWYNDNINLSFVLNVNCMVINKKYLFCYTQVNQYCWLYKRRSKVVQLFAGIITDLYLRKVW